MDEARLADLDTWITTKVLSSPADGWVGKGDFADFADFLRIMELAKAGLLDEGKRLARISMQLQADEQSEELAFASCQLGLPKFSITKAGEK